MPLLTQKYYNDFIAEHAPSTVSAMDLMLPYFHSCTGEDFRKILGTGYLMATPCREFTQDLLYLFYGKPSYRVSGAGTTRDLGRFPSSFILKTSTALSIERIFPFDSGAFLNNILADICGKFADKTEAIAKIADYNLGADLNHLAKFIKVFYGSDKAYIEVKPYLKRESLKGMCYELSRLLDMAVSHGSQKWDNRATTVEIQANANIAFNGTTIDAVIIPAQLISNDPELQNFFYNEGIEIVTYNSARTKPESVTDVINEIAETYLSNKGLI